MTEKIRSQASLLREKTRNSLKTIQFRERIEEFLISTSASPELSYTIKRDLSKKTDLPYYKKKKKVMKVSSPRSSLIRELMERLIQYDDLEFSVQLLKLLRVQQDQTLRKIPHKSIAGKTREKMVGSKNGVWEHAIPAKYIMGELIEMIRLKDLCELEQLLKVYEMSGQHFVAKEHDCLLNAKYKDSMPEGWSWKDENPELLIRYRLAGIDI